MNSPVTLTALAQALTARSITSRELVEQSLAAIRDPAGEGARTFIVVHDEAALAAADRIDAARRQGAKLPLLAGIAVSIKDLFDEAGQITRGGSVVLNDAPPAARDALVVERLRNAGAIIIGRTNLTEFAYSGLGINPHYGTPRNIYDRASARLPGGSSSGAAISITDGMAAAAIGTDTGGSVRIPAALNALVGFKPTAHRVPFTGMLPLSASLDSIGPIARTVADCALLDQVLTADSAALPVAASLRGLRLAVPTSVVQNDVSADVARAFSAALSRLSSAGAIIVEVPMDEFTRAAQVNPGGALVSAEAFAWHRHLIGNGADKYDPRVIVRIRAGEMISASDYADLLQQRQRFVSDIEEAARDYDAMLMPTTPLTAPTIAEVNRDDDSYFRYNALMLRNPAIVNLFDGCALSLPCHDAGTAPVGLMLAGTRNRDRDILAIGLAMESVVAGIG